MQEPAGIQLIRKIREEMLDEMNSLSREDWEKLVHERALVMEQRIAEQRYKQEQLVESTAVTA